MNKAIPDFYSQALQTKEIRPMAQPEIEVVELPQNADDDTKLKFTATVERRPDFELPDLDGMTIEVEKAEITDEDVNNRLEALRQRFATLVGVDRPAQNGDFVNIDLDAQIDGESVDSQEGISYEIGSGTMLDGLDEALEGLSAGEETSFESTLEGGEHEGEKALVKVKVNSVKAEELPELDDDFAQEASEFDTLDELKDEIKKNIESDALGMQATKARDAFIARIEEGLEIPAPKGVKEHMIEQQLQSMGTDKDKATADQKKEAEEAVDKLLEDRWSSMRSPRRWTSRCRRATCSTSSRRSHSSTAWIRISSSRPSCATARSAPLSRKWPVPRACSPACAPSRSPWTASRST